MDFVLFIIVFLLFIPLLIYTVFVPIRKNNKISNGIINHDDFSRKFVYKIPLSKDEIFQKLNMRNAADEMDYSFDIENQTINFTNLNVSIKYDISITEYNKFCILSLNQISFYANQGYIPIHMNSFWVNKVNAEIIPYTAIQK